MISYAIFFLNFKNEFLTSGWNHNKLPSSTYSMSLLSASVGGKLLSEKFVSTLPMSAFVRWFEFNACPENFVTVTIEYCCCCDKHSDTLRHKEGNSSNKQNNE